MTAWISVESALPRTQQRVLIAYTTHHGRRAEREAKHLAQIAALEKERDALRAELDALKSQEPVAWLIDWADEPDLGHYFSESAVDEDSGRSRSLFLHPVPASVPEGWQLVPIEPTQEMLDATSWPNCAGTDYKKMLAAAFSGGSDCVRRW